MKGKIALGFFLIISIVGLILLRDTPKHVKDTVKFQQKYMAESGRVKFDCELESNIASKGMIKIQPKLYSIDTERAYNTLLSSKKGCIKHSENHTIDEKEHSITYTNDVGEVLSVNYNMFIYHTKFFQKIQGVISQISEADELKKRFDIQNQDLTFCNRKAALDEVMTVLNNLGIFLEEFDCTTYAFKLENLNEFSKAENTSEKWTREDEGYYFCISQRQSDIPIYRPLFKTYTELSSGNAPIQVLYTRRGIEFLQIDKVFSFVEEQENFQLLPFENIADTIVKKYNKLLTNSSFKVEKGVLAYMIYEKKPYEFDSVPVWIVDITEESKKTCNKFQNIINAENGEEIVLQ